MTTPPAPVPAVVDGVDVDAAAAAVEVCPGVAGLDGGRFGEVATYLPGRRIAGIAVSGGRVKVSVRSRWGIPAPGLADRIAAVLEPFTGGRPADVLIADIDDPPGTPPPAPPPAGAADPPPAPPPAAPPPAAPPPAVPADPVAGPLPGGH